MCNTILHYVFSTFKMLPSCRAFYHQFRSHYGAKSKIPTKSVNFLWRGKRNVVFNMNFEKIHSNTKFLLTKLPCSTLCSLHQKRKYRKRYFLFCEDRTIEMFLRFRCLDLNTRHNHSTSLRFCFQGCLQRHLDFGAADKDHLDFLF